MCHVISGPGAGRAGREEEGYQGLLVLFPSLSFPHCVIPLDSRYHGSS